MTVNVQNELQLLYIALSKASGELRDAMREVDPLFNGAPSDQHVIDVTRHTIRKVSTSLIHLNEALERADDLKRAARRKLNAEEPEFEVPIMAGAAPDLPKSDENESREMTLDECRDALIEHVGSIVDYWSEDNPSLGTTRHRVSGVAFSILAALDGSSINVPAFIVSPSPHPSDKEYRKKNGENWWPENTFAAMKMDLSGSLHDHFARHHRSDRPHKK